ncbi:MAG TPA: signal peptidase I, partial [Thermoanaerobaculia bacterium]|nr:signal peptidase I [Thermoanaerobaculia bacterium]
MRPPDPPDLPGPEHRELRRRRSGGLRIWIDALIVAAMAATLTRTYLASGLRIESASMEPALLAGDHVLVNRFVYAAATAPAWIRPLLPVRAARRGEIVVVRLPGEPRTLLVKRCVAVPGDRVVIAPSQRLEPRVESHQDLPIDGYFVLGDGRERSY